MWENAIGEALGGLMCAGILGLLGCGIGIYRIVHQMRASQQRTERNLSLVIRWLRKHEQAIDRHEIAIAQLQARTCD